MKKDVKETRKQKIVSEIISYVRKYGVENEDMIFWEADPICVKDICVNIVAVSKIDDNLILFGDIRNGSFIPFRNSEDLDYAWLTDVLSDMKSTDKRMIKVKLFKNIKI